MVSKRTLAYVRRQVARQLTETCVIERVEVGTGPTGAPVNSWEEVASDVSCRVISAGSSSSDMMETDGGRESLVDRYRVILPVGTSVQADHRITVGSRVYEVLAVDDDLTDAAFVNCVCKRLRLRDG